MKHLIINPYNYSTDALKIPRDKSGFGHTKVKIWKPGILKYYDDKGEEYLAEISLDELKKLEGKPCNHPITVGHPSNMLTPKDVLKYQEGVVGGKYSLEEIDGEQWIVGDAALFTERALQVAESENNGGSAGYWRVATQTGEKKVSFSDLELNHYAIGCKNPRAKGAGLSLDDQSSDFAMVYSFDEQTTQPKRVIMAKRVLSAVKVGDFSLDERNVSYADESEELISELVDREKKLISNYEAEQVKTKASMDEQTGELKALRLKVEKLETEHKNMVSMDEVPKLAERLSSAMKLANELHVEGDFKTEMEANRAIAKNQFPGESFDNDEQIMGAIKTIKSDPELAKADIKSRKALASMDSTDHTGKKKIPLSEIDVRTLTKPKKTA